MTNDIDETIKKWRQQGERRERVYAVVIATLTIGGAIAFEIGSWLADTWARAGVAKGFGWL